MHHVAVKSKPYGTKSRFSGYNNRNGGGSSSSGGGSSSSKSSSATSALSPPPLPAAPRVPLTLSPEQAAVFEQVKRRSCVVMGPGGCGKSHMIRFMAEWAERENVEMAVTSLTGAAALVLQVPNATTLHRWTGVGLGKQSVSETLAKIRFKSYLVARWRKAQVLVIDEVSMMSRKLFELVDGVARAMRGMAHLPFGGLRVVAFGDFYQLAPVPDQRGGGYGAEDSAVVDTSGSFCFESPVWAEMFPPSAHFQLTQMVRQTGDPEFQSVLAEIRRGECGDAAAAYLAKRVVLPPAADAAGSSGPPPIKLFPKNAMVDRENSMAYARVKGEEQVYAKTQSTALDRWMHDGSGFNGRDAAAVRKASADQRKNELLFVQSGIPCAESLPLKVGTAVILLTNLCVEQGLANGSQGTVVRFALPGSDGDEYSNLTMMVASIESMVQMLPVVRFTNGVEKMIQPHWWQSASMPCVGVAQIPLKHGYARSIHSCQGMTCDSALIDAGGDVFAPGQTYVAISRVRSGDGLWLSSFDRTKVRAHPKVAAFYAQIEAVAAVKEVKEEEEEQDRAVQSLPVSTVVAPVSRKRAPPLRAADIFGDDE
jgi:ATP-dependent DNA helicase PIF1